MATLIEKSACFIVSGVAVAATAMMIWPEPRINLGIEMATIDQKERYRQRAALCYEIAATCPAILRRQ